MGDNGNTMMRNPNAGVQYHPKAQGRTNNAQLKLIAQNHPTGLTANLLKLFDPRPPLEYKPPAEKRQLPAYSGIAQFVSQFAEAGDPEYAPSIPKTETRAEKKARIRKLKLEQGATKVAEELQKYDPLSNSNATGDPYKTLFVGRLSYETSERSLKREFEAYGPIKRVQLVSDKETKKSRGYAFIEYVHTRDMKNAYKHADGRKVDNRRVVVDVERGRTVPNWRPRRLGGGLGSGRFSGEGADHKRPARVQQLADCPRSEEHRTRRDDRHADRRRVQERDRGERTSARLYEWSDDLEPTGERHSHRGHDRTWGNDQVRDRERDRGHDRDQGDKDKHRIHGRDYDRQREKLERPHDRHRDRASDSKHAGRKRDRSYELQEDQYGKQLANYHARPKNIEPEAAEIGEGYMEGNYQFDKGGN